METISKVDKVDADEILIEWHGPDAITGEWIVCVSAGGCSSIMSARTKEGALEKALQTLPLARLAFELHGLR